MHVRTHRSARNICLLSLLVTLAACETAADRAKADSVNALVLEQQLLMAQLTAQKDSIASVVDDADNFISQIDSQISRVKGLPAAKRSAVASESPIADQRQARKDMLAKVDALVDRARATAEQLAESQRREKALRGENAKLQARIDSVQSVVAELTALIDRQAISVATLTARTDSLDAVLNQVRASTSRAYYLIGTEEELLKQGVIVHEGGTNLLVTRVGRTVVPSRNFDRSLFTPIDMRAVQQIEVPDTTRRYTIVSRQSLDNAEVAGRDRSTFKGHLRITDAESFWAPSRYLIIVKR